MVIEMALRGRRQFLGGLLAGGLIPKPTWADVGGPAFLSAAATPDGGYLLCGIDAGLNIVFKLPLPDRGHAAAAHPTRPEAVAFARRPGRFAIVIDCTTGKQIATLNAPAGRHFYGHGVFSADGTRLYTTENDYDVGRGRIGVWDSTQGYARIDEWDSGGIGPHDIKRLPGSDGLVVANGGIDTHPDTGRTKLNIPTMQPNLSYVEQGAIIETGVLPDVWHRNSIRHLAVSDTGLVAFGMQWQGDGQPSALVGVHNRGGPMDLLQVPDDAGRMMQGYIGSIAFSQDGQSIAATSPRGGQVQIFDVASRSLRSSRTSADVCGLAANGGGFITTSGTGSIETLTRAGATNKVHQRLMFDNHLIAL